MNTALYGHDTENAMRQKAAFMEAAFHEKVRKDMKQKIEELVEPLIDDILEDAIRSFETSAQVYLEPNMQGLTLQLILHDKRENK